MHPRRLSVPPALLVAALIAGCAGGPTQRAAEDRPVRAAATGGHCLNIDQARNFRFLAQNHLIVYAPATQPFHIELSHCPELGGQHQLALRGRTGQMCGAAGDEVVAHGAFTERCPVLRVTRVSAGEIEALIDGFSNDPRTQGEFEVVIPQRDE